MNAERRRLTLAFLLSLLIHALLLGLTFGGQGLGLPGLGFPWGERRTEAPDLHVMLVPAQVTAAESMATPAKEALPQVSIRQTVAVEPAPTPLVPPATVPSRTAKKAVASKAEETEQAEPAAEAKPEPDFATGGGSAEAPLRTEGPSDAAPNPAVIAMEPSDETTWLVPPPPASTSGVAAALNAPNTEAVMPVPRDTNEVAQKRAEPEVQERAVEVAKVNPPEREAQRQADPLEAARVEAAQLEAARQEAGRVEAARLEAVRQAAARQEAQRQETAQLAAAQLEAQRQEAARQETARVEAARLEAVRQAAARAEAARFVAQRREAVRQAAARQEAQGQESARQEAALVQAEQEEDARREARRRAMGRQLDEEAAWRQAAADRPPSQLPPSFSTARRVRLWGRSDPNVELVEYAEAWARKIQFNTPVDTLREVTKRPHTDPMVTVAIRSDGSVESVTFVLSSGVPEVDEAIRRIVQSHLPYQAFPPGLAREYDVIELRRTWHFDVAIRLY